MEEIRSSLAPDTPVEVWFQDEMRVGQKNKLTYRWARTGSRPRAAHDQRTQSTYLFGAVCPELGTGAALVLPFCNSEAMQLHLNEIATKVGPGAHAIVILDQAGWHGAKELKVLEPVIEDRLAMVEDRRIIANDRIMHGMAVGLHSRMDDSIIRPKLPAYPGEVKMTRKERRDG